MRYPLPRTLPASAWSAQPHSAEQLVSSTGRLDRVSQEARGDEHQRESGDDATDDERLHLLGRRLDLWATQSWLARDCLPGDNYMEVP